MTLDQAKLRQLHEAVKEFTSERITIVAIPGMIRHQGQMIDAVEVTIGHVPTRKIVNTIYRGLSSNFKRWLKEQVDKIDNR